MKTRLVASAMGLLAIFCLLDSRISGAAGLDLKIQNGKVSLHADQVSLISVLKAIAGNEDIYLESSSPLTKPVSLDLTGLSVEESLRRLLAKENYTLIFKKTGETRFVVTEIRILAPGTKDKSAPRIKPKRVARVDTITTAPPPTPPPVASPPPVEMENPLNQKSLHAEVRAVGRIFRYLLPLIS